MNLVIRAFNMNHVYLPDPDDWEEIMLREQPLIIC